MELLYSLSYQKYRVLGFWQTKLVEKMGTKYTYTYVAQLLHNILKVCQTITKSIIRFFKYLF